MLDFASANPAAGTTAPGTVTWDYTNLHPYETRYYVVYTNLNAPTDTPPANIGDILNLTAEVTSIDNDIDTTNNAFELEQEVMGSFDPNNIICLEGEAEEVENIGDYLHYLINFENTGTGAATFVVLTQEIDEEMFDPATFEILDNSHNMNASRTGNMVEYRFDDINLEPEAQGSVLFRIKTRSNLVEGDQVMNYANIVFDYNYAILTNEAITLFETIVMGTDNIAEPSSVSIYPNPVKDVVTVNSQNTITSLELYDINGRLLQTIMTNDTNANIDISSKAAGLYLLKVVTEKGSMVQRIIKD